MATEDILMAATTGKDGKTKRSRTGDRQALHERIRRHAQAAAREVKQHGRPNDLIQRLKNDQAFMGIDFDETLDAKRFVGLAPRQVDQFLKEVVRPITTKYRAVRNKPVALKV